MANLLQPSRQYVLQESPHELVGVQPHRSPSLRTAAAIAGLLFWLAWTEAIIAPPTPDFACSDCGGPLVCIRFEPPTRLSPAEPTPYSQPP